MDGLCKYSNALGTPGQGVHAPRMFGLAAVDLLLTAILAIAIAASLRGSFVAFLSVFVLLLTLAVGVHELFCVDTRLNAFLFGREWRAPGKKSADHF